MNKDDLHKVINEQAIEMMNRYGVDIFKCITISKPPYPFKFKKKMTLKDLEELEENIKDFLKC